MPIDHRDWEAINAQFTSGQVDPSSLDQDALESIRTALVDRLRRSSLLRRYLDHLARPNNANTEPWHAEGERLYAALLVALAGRTLDGEPSITIGYDRDSFGPSDTLRHAVALAATILMAQPYLWTNQIEQLAQATPLPTHVISNETLPYPFMFWSRQTAHGEGDVETNWLLVIRSSDGIRLALDILDLHTQQMHVTIGDIRHGATYPDDVPAEGRDSVGAVLARIAFLNSPYVETTRARLPRALRRLAVREHTLPPDPTPEGEIAVVTLRRDAHQRVADHLADTEGARAYRHQWWVSGHIRAQWYRSEQAHHPIWIAPYLKGDPDAPLLPKVYAVTR